LTYEKPWAKPFGMLLEELRDSENGEIRAPDRESTADLYFYPEFHFEADGGPVTLSVRDYAGSNAALLAGADNTEYLRIEVRQSTPHSLMISPEWLRDRFMKFLGFEKEYETGVKEFDRKYLLKTGSEADERLLDRPEFRDAVDALGEFARLAVQPDILFTSIRIANEKDLAADRVRDRIARTLALARLCR
jgi:hypothetical protein